MNEQSISSINFVISAAYTFTFANSFFYMFLIDPSKGVMTGNIELNFAKVGCGIVCLIMSLRFFFGNNSYIHSVMRDINRGAWQKFYQFFFIALQSIILLICSYAIREPAMFVVMIAALFIVETIWYGLTFLVDPIGVRASDNSVDRIFFQAQVTNFIFWISALMFYWAFHAHTNVLVSAVLIAFLLNTAYDAWKNMAQYMGSGTAP